MGSDFRILAVCTGNVHRSALAATMLTLWAGWYLPDQVSPRVAVSSAGTAAAVGAAMTARVTSIAEALGAADIEHRAAQVTDDAIATADLVLVASRAHREDVLGRVPSALRRTFTMREAGRTAEQLTASDAPSTLDEMHRVVAKMGDARVAVGVRAGDDDIIDPQGLGDDAYLRMAREEIPALASLATVLFGMPRADLDAYRAVAQSERVLRGRDA